MAGAAATVPMPRATSLSASSSTSSVASSGAHVQHGRQTSGSHRDLYSISEREPANRPAGAGVRHIDMQMQPETQDASSPAGEFE